MKRLLVLVVFCSVTLSAFTRQTFAEQKLGGQAKESPITGGVELELTTPASGNALSETIGTAEYNWRTIPLDAGIFSGFGIYERSDSRAEFMEHHTVAYAPFDAAPFLAMAIEYGANQDHDYWQGGVQFIAQRIPAVREYFQHIVFAYFSDIRDAPASSEWMARFGTQQIPLTPFAALFVEGIYRYRPSEERARDVGSIEFWFTDLISCGVKGCFDLGASWEKDGVQWLPFWGVRVKF